MRVVTKNESFYLDDKQVKIPLSEYFTAHVPLAKGVKTKEDIKELIQLITVINEDDFLQKELTGVQRKKNGEYTLYVRSGDYTVELGAVENIAKKLKKLKVFYYKAHDDNTIKQYKIINLKYHNQVVCTKINQDGAA